MICASKAGAAKVEDRTYESKLQEAAELVDKYYKSREENARKLGYESKVDDVLVILGYQHDSKYETIIDAILGGWKPKTLNMVQHVKVHGAVDAVLYTLAKMRIELPEIKTKVKNSVRGELGKNLPENWRDLVDWHKTICEVVSTAYTGKWFKKDRIPQNWVSLGKYSTYFARKSLFKGQETFAVPKPIEEMIAQLY